MPMLPLQLQTLAVLALAASAIVAANVQQRIFDASAPSPVRQSQGANGAGRFLHITDMHPDKYYQTGTKINDACHTIESQAAAELAKKHKKKRKSVRAGHWGAPVSVCDSPQRLITSTFDWIAEKWTEDRADGAKRAFDFIIWTGDTARHDIDFTHPRKAAEIFDYNRWALRELETRFPDTPIVPNVGNNDIIPHNIMFPGPNSMTRAFRDIWSLHIPNEQQDSFLDGGYFSREVIPDNLAVISMNTLYWFDSNAATRGCKKLSEPGSLQLDWLTEQLTSFRNRSMQAHLIGHVPPTAGNYFADCYEQYTDIVLHFQDTIVGQHFGHMNVDALFLQEDFTVTAGLDNERAETDGSVHTESFASDLRKDYDLVPTSQKTNLDAYLPFFVAPSVVPTYYPTVRVWTYNITKPVDGKVVPQVHDTQEFFIADQSEDNAIEEDADEEDDTLLERISAYNQTLGNRLTTLERNHRRPRHHKKHRRNHRKISRRPANNAPSRKLQYLTMLGYSQWVLDLPQANRAYEKSKSRDEPSGVEYQLEYTTYDERTLWSDFLPSVGEASTHVHRPVPKQLLEREISRRRAKAPKLKRQAADGLASLFGLRNWFFPHFWSTPAPQTFLPRPSIVVRVPKALRRLTDYRLPSMTVANVLDWSRELAGNDKLWARYQDRIYTESGRQD